MIGRKFICILFCLLVLVDCQGGGDRGGRGGGSRGGRSSSKSGRYLFGLDQFTLTALAFLVYGCWLAIKFAY